VAQAAIVQASTCYGHDNSYVCDAVTAHPERFTAVGSVDLLQPDATDTIRAWVARGLNGLRLFTGGSTAAFDASAMDDPRSFPAWELASELGLSICVQTDAKGLPTVADLAKRFPNVRIVLDHLSRPNIEDGAPYARAQPLWDMAAHPNVFLKLTPRTTDAVQIGQADSDSFFERLVGTFGSGRIAWGSNFPASEGSMKANLETAKAMLAILPEVDQAAIFAGTARRLYPALASSQAAAA